MDKITSLSEKPSLSRIQKTGLMFGGSILLASCGLSPEAECTGPAVPHVIQGGETFWQFADRHNPDQKDDPRLIIDALQEFSGHSSNLVAGEQIMLPTACEVR